MSEDLKRSITVAMGAHGMWKSRLADAAKTGQSEWTVDILKQDNQCEFGKWLYALPAQFRTNEHYEIVKKKHAEFHKLCAHILGDALAGKLEKAQNELAADSEFAKQSNNLILLMSKWKRAI